MHHGGKVDAPSGTALGLGQAAAAGRDIDLADAAVRSRDGHTGARVPEASVSPPCAAAMLLASIR